MARTEGVYGPYKHGKRWRVVEVNGAGQRALVSFETERLAHKYVQAAKRVAGGRTAGEAVSAYLDHLRATPGKRGPRRESTVVTVGHRLVAFLGLLGRDYPMATLDKRSARDMFARRTEVVSVATAHGELVTVKCWAKWCAHQGWLPGDPFEGLVVQGERNVGKPQLRVDPARRFLAAALGEESREGLAASIALLMGLRASEVTGLRARDIDDSGRLLWVSRSKTKKGLRRLKVPEVLRARLVQLAAGKRPDDCIWGEGVDRHWLGYHVVRICKLARVDRVTPHGLRGTWASLSVEALPTEHVANALGHESPTVTRAAYLAAGAEESAAADRVGNILGERFPAGQIDSEKLSN